MNILKPIFATIIFLSPMATYASFADTLRELKGTLSQITDTTKEITGVKKEVSGLRGSNSEAQYTQGQTLSPKINNLSLYKKANKSSNVISKLSKNNSLVFSGNTHSSGLIEVSTDYGDGWVESHLVH